MLDVLSNERLLVTSRAPWDDNIQDFLDAVSKRIHFESLLVGVYNTERPRLDETLISYGLPNDEVKTWVEYGVEDDQLLKRCMQQGAVSGPAHDSGWSKRSTTVPQWLCYNVLTSGATQNGCWFVSVGRSGTNFSENEIHSLGLMLRIWESRFNRPKEPDMVRLLVGHDDRLIYTDPQGEQTLLDHKINIDQVMNELRNTVAQRWPDFEDRQLHDIALELANLPWWLRFRRQRSVADETAVYWYLELRPLEDGDLATVSTVSDDRIGRAVGYIHDHYNESPNLNTISGCVKISPFHFHRLFSKQVGVTPKQYVLQKQIQMAKWMLRSRNNPISQIAEETGFASHGHFTSTFRRFVGVSPTEYRQAGYGYEKKADVESIHNYE